MEAVGRELKLGRRRIKIKVCPGFDTEYIAAVRAEFPDIVLMVDANNAYSEADFDRIADWDRFNLAMIEQPLDAGDVYFHSLLRKRVRTPICLDESMHTVHDVKCAIALKSADIVNIKVCRVGGLCNAKKSTTSAGGEWSTESAPGRSSVARPPAAARLETVAFRRTAVRSPGGL